MLEIRNVIARSAPSIHPRDITSIKKLFTVIYAPISPLTSLLLLTRDDLCFHIYETKGGISFFFFFNRSIFAKEICERETRATLIDDRDQRNFRRKAPACRKKFCECERTYFNLFQIFVRSMHQQRLPHIHYAKQLQIQRGRSAILARGWIG